MLAIPYFVTCYGHAMSKCYHNVINDLNVCWNEKGFNQRSTISFSKDHYMDKKKWAKNLYICIFSPLKVENFCQDSICIQSHSFQRNFGIQGYHQSMLFTTNHDLVMQNS
jgi:hypothetical protein